MKKTLLLIVCLAMAAMAAIGQAEFVTVVRSPLADDPITLTQTQADALKADAKALRKQRIETAIASGAIPGTFLAKANAIELTAEEVPKRMRGSTVVVEGNCVLLAGVQINFLQGSTTEIYAYGTLNADKSICARKAELEQFSIVINREPAQ